MTDSYGLPVPSDESPLPWRLCGLFEIMSSNETYVSELDESLGDIDAEFIVHAANNIIACREIVRRLAGWDKKYPKGTIHSFNAEKEHDAIAADAANLWDKMQEEAKGGDGG